MNQHKQTDAMVLANWILMKAADACLLLLLGTVLLTAGCDSFLAEEPKSQISGSNFFKTKKDAIGATNDVYHALGAFTGPYNIWHQFILDIPSDEAHFGFPAPTDAQNMQTYQWGPTNRFVEAWWRFHYRGINRANTAITGIPDVDMNEDLRARLVGEAKFLRALFYFNLVRAFGPVPLVTDPTDDLGNVNVPRTSVDSVYNLIIGDLQAAEGALPPSYDASNTGRATSGTAKSLLAKVYLTRESWQQAAQKAREVINSGEYALLGDYADLWNIQNENNAEAILSVQYKQDVLPGVHTSWYAPRLSGIQRGTSFGNDVPEPDWVASFPEGDYRAEVIFKTQYPKYSNPQDTVHFDQAYLFKFFNVDAPLFNSGVNYPILRYADVLLMYAEALNELGRTGEAYKYINMVRARAKLPPLLGGLSQAVFRDAVLKERSWELGMEAHRWFDLKRAGRLVEVMSEDLGQSIPEYRRRYPIPLRELRTNPKLKQNPGY